jgi:hypothetical protein
MLQWLRLGFIVGSIGILLAAIMTPSDKSAGGHDAEEVPVESFESAAVRVVVPAYPESSLHSGTSGVGVAMAEVGPVGQVGRVSVLEAPDAAIAVSLRAAILRWVFPSALPNRSGVRGRIVVYFAIDEGRGLVLTPRQMAARQALKNSEGTRGRLSTPPASDGPVHAVLGRVAGGSER